MVQGSVLDEGCVPADTSDCLACRFLSTSTLIAMAEKSVIEVNDVLKPLLMKDLRTNCRARNLNPGGSKEALVERLSDDMRKSRN